MFFFLFLLICTQTLPFHNSLLNRSNPQHYLRHFTNSRALYISSLITSVWMQYFNYECKNKKYLYIYSNYCNRKWYTISIYYFSIRLNILLILEFIIKVQTSKYSINTWIAHEFAIKFDQNTIILQTDWLSVHRNVCH